MNALLSGLTIGALTLAPEFNSDVRSYTANTSNATNKVTATPKDANSTVSITVNGAAIENGTAATWADGENTVLIKVTAADNSAETDYSVTVSKA